VVFFFLATFFFAAFFFFFATVHTPFREQCPFQGTAKPLGPGGGSSVKPLSPDGPPVLETKVAPLVRFPLL